MGVLSTVKAVGKSVIGGAAKKVLGGGSKGGTTVVQDAPDFSGFLVPITGETGAARVPSQETGTAAAETVDVSQVELASAADNPAVSLTQLVRDRFNNGV